MQFVDTNIFLRFLTNDDQVKARKCFDLFENARLGKIKLQTTESVLTEVVYILSSKKLYALSPKEIYERILPMIKIKTLKILNKKTLLRAFQLYIRYKLDIEDSILLAQMEDGRVKEIFSYDRGFDKVAEIKRLEP